MKKLLIIALALMCTAFASCSDKEAEKESHIHSNEIQQIKQKNLT